MKKNILIVGVLVVAVVTVLGIKNKKDAGQEPAGCEGGVCTLPAPTGQAAAKSAASDATQPLPKLLDLGAGKCVPCKMMEPILEELTETYAGKLNVEFIDVWENQHAGEEYGIRMIPTQIFYDADGNELFRHEGFFAKEDIIAKWSELGVNLSNE
jgi:thioredoxin 1